MPPDSVAEPVVIVVLAGGLARRMGGGDKCLKPIAGKPLLAHVLDRIRPQASHIVLNANGDPARFSDWRLPVVPDSIDGFAGPLAGVLAGLDWAADNVADARRIVSVPGDAPFLPTDLVARLVAAADADGAELACAASAGRHHPVAGLWPVAEREALRRALVEEEIRKVDRWTGRYRLAIVDFPDTPVDPFFNANTFEDIAEAERVLAAG